MITSLPFLLHPTDRITSHAWKVNRSARRFCTSFSFMLHPIDLSPPIASHFQLVFNLSTRRPLLSA
jgi:hypothetical protein